MTWKRRETPGSRCSLASGSRRRAWLSSSRFWTRRPACFRLGVVALVHHDDVGAGEERLLLQLNVGAIVRGSCRRTVRST